MAELCGWTRTVVHLTKYFRIDCYIRIKINKFKAHFKKTIAYDKGNKNEKDKMIEKAMEFLS